MPVTHKSTSWLRHGAIRLIVCLYADTGALPRNGVCRSHGNGSLAAPFTVILSSPNVKLSPFHKVNRAFPASYLGARFGAATVDPDHMLKVNKNTYQRIHLDQCRAALLLSARNQGLKMLQNDFERCPLYMRGRSLVNFDRRRLIMSTRALYTFKGTEGNWNVYKHHDGYPSGAARTIKMAINLFAWPLPRYESDAFATAFIAAGKFGSWIETKEQLLEWWADYGVCGQYKKFGGNGGGVRMMPQGDPTLVACKNCSDIAYRYEVWQAKTKLHVKAFTGSWWDDKSVGPMGENLVFNGTFDDFYADALKKEAA